MLRQGPGAGQARQHRRGRRHHRCPVDRRAGHAAHDEDVPHRRRGVQARRAVYAGGQERGLRQARQREDGPQQGRAARRNEQERRDPPRQRGGPRAGEVFDHLRRKAQGRGRPEGERGPDAGRVGPLDDAYPFGGVGQGEVRRYPRRQHHAGARRRGDGPRVQGHHRDPRRRAAAPHLDQGRKGKDDNDTGHAEPCPLHPAHRRAYSRERGRRHLRRRRHIEDAEGDDQDEGHHGRSAEGRRAFRGQAAEGERDGYGDLRPCLLRQALRKAKGRSS